LMDGAFEKIRSGDVVSLDSVQAAVYPGAIWPWRQADSADVFEQRPAPADPISRHILTLTLLDPAASNFRPAGCQSAHDVLRYCHEKAVEAMFTVNDAALEKVRHRAKTLRTDAPLHITVLDIGGGLLQEDPEAREVLPEQVVSAPFQAFWRGATHPEVSWKREMPAGLADLASVMAKSLTPEEYPRPLGLQSYLLVADEYMNLNARVAYHFTLVDASLTDTPGKNYIAFRFVGGGATRYRRNLRKDVLEYVFRYRLDEEGLAFRYQGSDVVDLKQVDWVELVDRERTSMRIALDRRTHLPIRVVIVSRDPHSRQRIEEVEYYANYHAVDGVMTPMQIQKQRNGINYYQVFFTAYRYNTGLDDALFTRAALEERWAKLNKKKK
ncbi:MAG: outer membrane lipoprotein-sorting protein, partial [Firmicutes bacterium]|nr:outer membrane lipoprotein-sorting protein [Bacillota bacterium]